jgi:hypothetical protein
LSGDGIYGIIKKLFNGKTGGRVRRSSRKIILLKISIKEREYLWKTTDPGAGRNT